MLYDNKGTGVPSYGQLSDLVLGCPRMVNYQIWYWGALAWSIVRFGTGVPSHGQLSDLVLGCPRMVNCQIWYWGALAWSIIRFGTGVSSYGQLSDFMKSFYGLLIMLINYLLFLWPHKHTIQHAIQHTHTQTHTITHTP